MPSNTAIFFILSLLLSIAQTVLAQAPFVRVFVLSGQSNMAGGSNPVALTGAATDIWFDNSSATQAPATLQTSWLRLKTTTERGDGVHAGAAELLAPRFAGDRLALVKVTQGATGIGYWNTPGQAGYERLMERISSVRARLGAQVAAHEISGFAFEGFFWMQGEGEIDATVDRGSVAYLGSLRTLLAAVETQAATPDLPSAIGRTSWLYSPEILRPNTPAFPGSGDLRDTAASGRDYTINHEFVDTGLRRGRTMYQGYSLMVRSAQQFLGRETDRRSDWADSDDLPLVDYFHFPTGTTGKVELGKRLARAWMRVAGDTVPEELRVHAGPHRWAHPGTLALEAVVSGTNGEPVTVSWELITGPDSVSFSTPNALTTPVTLTTPGTYALWVKVSTPTRQHNHIVNVIVYPADQNLPAYGYAEPIFVESPLKRVPIGATLFNPDSDPLTLTWARQMGAGPVFFEDAAQLNTHARFHAAGGYTLRLTVDDGSPRGDGNSSGWVLLPVIVGTGNGAEIGTYAARWPFEEPDYLLGEIAVNGLEYENLGVTHSTEARLGAGSGAFDGSAYFKLDRSRFSNDYPHGSPAALSFVAWIRPSSPATGTQVIYDQGGGANAFTVRLHNGLIQAGFKSNGGALVIAESSAPPAAEWTHIAAVGDSATLTLKLFIDGEPVATVSDQAIVKMATMNEAGALGARLDNDAFNASGTGATNFYAGLLDEARTYMYALDQAAIDTLVAAGTIPDLDSDEDGLPDDWEYRYFPEIGAQGPLDDPHATGLPLIVHYAMATDPRAFSAGAFSGPELRVIDDASWLTLRYRRATEVADTIWNTLASPDLASPPEAWTALVPDGVNVIEEVIDSDLDGDGAATLVELRVRLFGPSLFLRHRVTLK